MTGAWYKLAVVRIRGAYVYQKKNPTISLLTPKDGGRFILTSMANINHQVNLRSLLGPCFAVVCNMKPDNDY